MGNFQPPKSSRKTSFSSGIVKGFSFSLYIICALNKLIPAIVTGESFVSILYLLIGQFSIVGKQEATRLLAIGQQSDGALIHQYRESAINSIKPASSTGGLKFKTDYSAMFPTTTIGES